MRRCAFTRRTNRLPSLQHTLEAANAACNRISTYAWDNRIFRQYDLHHALYHPIREATGLAAQMVVRCTAKVADAYKLDRQTKRTFRPHGAIAYDDRILSWETDNHIVSIWTVEGRQRMSYGAGERQRHYLQFRQGETDLVYFNGMFFLLAVCDIPDPDEQEVAGALGVDLGVVNIATTSDGDIQTSEAIERNRQRTRARGPQQRARHSNWAFGHLRQFVKYKARRAGIPVVYVDPKYTSQRCYACGHTEDANRRSQSQFLCCVCGHTDHADVNAAKNIALRGEVLRPIVSDAVNTGSQ